MSNKPRFPFGGKRSDDEDTDKDKNQPSGGARPSSPFSRGSSPSTPPSKPAPKPSFGGFGGRSSSRDDDEDEDDNKPSGNRPGGFSSSSRAPFNRSDDDDDDKDRSARPGAGNRIGSSSPFGPKPGSTSSSRPNDPPKPGSTFGSRPNDPPKPGSTYGSRPNDPPKPGSTYGSRPNDPPKQGSSFGSRPNDLPKPGSSFGSRPNDPPKSNSPFGSKPNSSSSSKPADKRDDKPAGGGLGGFRSPFGAKPDDKSAKPADKRDDKPAGGGLGGFRSPFGAKPDDKSAKSTSSSAGGGQGGLRTPFGGAKPADKKDDKSTGGFRSPFGGAKPADKPADKKDNKPAGGGFGGIRLPFGSKPDDKSARPGDAKKPATGPTIPQRTSNVTSPPRTTGVAPAVDPKRAGSKVPPARGEKVAKPLERTGNKVQVQQGLSLDQKLDLTGYALMGFGILIFFAIIQPSEGSITKGIADVVGGFVGGIGLAGVLIPCFGIGLWLFIRHFSENPLVIRTHRIIGYVLLYLTLITTAHTIVMLTKPVPNMGALIKASDAIAKAHTAGNLLANGGGWAGGELYKLLIGIVGQYGIFVVLVGFWIAAIMLSTSLTLAEITAYVKSIFHWFARVRASYSEHQQAAAQARAATAPPLTIENPAMATMGAGATPAAATLAAPSSGPAGGNQRGLPAGTPATSGAPRLAPPISPTPIAKASPFGRAPASEAKDNAPAAASEASSKSTPFGPRPGGTASTAAAEPAPAKPAGGIFGNRFGAGKTNESPKPGLFGARPPATSAKPSAEPDDTLDDELDDADVESVAPPIVKPSPFGSRQSEPAKSSPFGARPGSGATASSQDNTDDDEDLEDDALAGDSKSAPVRPAASLSNRPFGASPNTGSNTAAKLPPPTSSRSTPFGAKPGSAPVRPADKGKDADFDDEDDELDDDAKSPSFKPATPIGNRTPFGASPTNSASKPNPFGARPSGSATAKPADDAAKDDQKSESLKPATPIGNRSPFNAKPSSPFGSSPTARPVNNDDDEDEAEDDEPESFKPATPIGNRPMPAPTPSASFTRPVPKPGLATTPQFDEEDEEEDNDPKYVPIDDADEDLPRSNGPRPTVSGGVGTAPASMPRPADPVLPRSRPGQEPSKPPLGGSTGSSFSPFGQRPPATTTKAETKPEATINPVKAADPSMPAKQPESAQPPTSTVATSTPPASPSPAAPPLEGVIIRSKGGQNGEIPDYRQLLESGSQQKVNDEVLKQQAKIIEETLLAFSAPGKVVETNPGPTITQFGVEPDYLTTRQGKKIRIKVGQIARLDADLALALSARSIRIEAPVPGKGYVGIEVPNKETAVVSLRDVMDSEEFERINSKLRIGLGLSVDGAPIATDLTQMPHLLIAGTTGSGKSVCVNAIIACLLLQNSPDDLKMIMVDPKRVELTGYNGIPHLVSAVVVDLERIVGVLKWVTREMDERYKKFAQAGARNIVDYNGKIAGNQPKLPYLVVVIDELADLMMLAPDETEKVLTRLAQMARATGIHLIVSTQRPSVDVVTGLIKANFPARISFAVASSVDSRVILDSPGAEKLLGRGDMLFQSPDAAAPLRMQGVFVSDAEINRITAYWKGQKIEPTSAKAAMSSPLDFNRPAEPVQSRQERFNSSPSSNSSSSNSGGNFSNSGNQRVFGSPPSSSSIGNRPATPANSGTSESAGNASEDDEMYDEAVEMVQRAGKPSIQMLQRRLRIGYTRAARLIELMEKRGAISSADARSATANDGGDSEDNTKEA